jgi:hypothetical protein
MVCQENKINKKTIKGYGSAAKQIRTPPLLCTSPLQNLSEYASIPGKIACHSS